MRGSVLAENGMRFDAGGHETWAPGGIAAVLVAVAVMNVAAVSWSGTATWIVQSLVLVVHCLVIHSQLTAVSSVRSAFARKGDPVLAGIDVAALLKAAESGFPSWTWKLANARNAVVFAASFLAPLVTATA
ncbi:hypothetical protein [Nonomuraea aridisoli]|uniref:Uncharacterized protein n=1 Tax=Nonomuraea aridisoli TaxID=2070368 RepID=A0A2W2EA40_9ACTN|nr:hypothetical protein [Nonomuraea aridisoli]PZG14005.1 hypothetical protein C1J01_28355 [Nonomuraea aridisoli]